jgi:hypothetical protein
MKTDNHQTGEPMQWLELSPVLFSAAIRISSSYREAGSVGVHTDKEFYFEKRLTYTSVT